MMWSDLGSGRRVEDMNFYLLILPTSNSLSPPFSSLHPVSCLVSRLLSSFSHLLTFKKYLLIHLVYPLVCRWSWERRCQCYLSE